MLYFAACLAVGVAAIVGTAALAGSVEAGFRAKSREILGADFTVDARRPLPEELDAAIAGIEGAERSAVLETASMVSVPTTEGYGRSRLALIQAVEGRFPLYGEIVTDPPGGLGAHLSADTVVVAPTLLESIGLAVGDELRVGARSFRIAATVEREPGRLGFASFLGPPVYLSRKGFDGTGLMSFGARIRYRTLVALPAPLSRTDLDALVAGIEAEVPGAAYLDFDTHFEAGPGGRRSTRRLETFVGLVALLSLVVGGIGVSQIVRAWLAGRTPAIAVMRCLGVRPAQILILSLGHSALLGLVGSLAGAALGCTIPHLVRAAAPDLFPDLAVAIFPVAAILRGVGLGVGLAVAFALLPLTAIWRVPPARVLRSDAEPLPPNRIAAAAAAGLLLLGVLGAAWVQTSTFAPAAWFTGGFAVLVVLLYLCARTLTFAARHAPRRWLPPHLAHGVAALARPGAGTTGAVVALGLGTMVVTGMWLIETRLREGILGQVSESTPTVFLVDIQPDEWEGVRSELVAAGAPTVDQVPVVTARIASIDGKSVEELAAQAKDADRSRRTLTREQRLTWRRELTPDNEIVEGALWSDPDRAEVSLEKRYATRLGVGLGSNIEFDIQGVPLTLTVTSLRSVEWQSFNINFFLVVEPGGLDHAPALYLANARVPADRENELQDRMAAAHPGVTLLRVRPILDQVLTLLGRVAAGIRLLGSFTILAGLAILAGAVSATALRRGREVALLKTLGVTRPGITVLLLTEYGLSGLVAGAVGAGGALLLAHAYFEFLAELPVTLPLMTLPVAAVGCGILAAVCGLAASARALNVRPIEALR
jgi:putative ABC transport system permease protein